MQTNKRSGDVDAVDDTGSDTDSISSYEEIEQYLVLDLGTDLTSDMLHNAASSHHGVSLIGLETATPYLRVGNLAFQGSFDTTLGTDLIFTSSRDDESRPRRAPEGPLPLSIDNNRPDINMSLLTKSTRKILFKPIMLEPKEQASGEQAAMNADASVPSDRQDEDGQAMDVDN
ncbi:hypothetical protein BC832DRAFT_590469 [Gaertneriomyces semiglobifer]|nr:hypothetical protein BC832DRAFT_590469 [Gaertneriomyces semiglobifer]